jgi:hypothetical protein
MRGSSPRGNQLERYGRWVAIAGIALVVTGRLSNSLGLLLFGLAVALLGVGLGIQAGRSSMQIYVRELIPGGTDQADPFAGQVNSGQSVPPDGIRRYVGTVVWPGGIGKGILLELSSSGMSTKPTWMTGLLMAKRPTWTLPWSAVRGVEIATIPGTGSAPSPVKFSIAQPASVFLFFCRTPAALVEDVRGLQGTAAELDAGSLDEHTPVR